MNFDGGKVYLKQRHYRREKANKRQIVDLHLKTLSPSNPQITASNFDQRLKLETYWYLDHGVGSQLAQAAAARVASLYIMADINATGGADLASLPHWIPMMSQTKPPKISDLQRDFRITHVDGVLIQNIWSYLGTTEHLMQAGGDHRLNTNSKSALTDYGCSHRPRPWAITFASSTASSISQRGYSAAESCRLKTTLRLLKRESRQKTVGSALNSARQAIYGAFLLPPGTSIVFAASGTDTEILALALTRMKTDGEQITNILLAPEETGRGVPLAAHGKHFASKTSLGANVIPGDFLTGFPKGTTIVNVPLRSELGEVRSDDDVEKEIISLLNAALNPGRRPILHVLDVSKTGLLFPKPRFLAKLRTIYGDQFDIVVDACQTRLSAKSLRAYLLLDATVLITGSKFYTGPPFSGAAIIPQKTAAYLRSKLLPTGMSDYFTRDDFPHECPAARHLGATGNYGLALRWHAALAEIKAFSKTTENLRTRVLDTFQSVLLESIANENRISILETPGISRDEDPSSWENKQTIFTILIHSPFGAKRYLTPTEAKAVYFWLNSDLSQAFNNNSVAAAICHIGQPVPLNISTQPGKVGTLRISAGARLIAREPSHQALSERERLNLEFCDLRTVIQKLTLILDNWALITRMNPSPVFRTIQNIRKKD